MFKNVMALLCALFVACCNMSNSGLQGGHISESELPAFQTKYTTLESWWSFFGDPVLDKFVSSALALNVSAGARLGSFPNDDMTGEALRAYYKDPRVSLVESVAQDYIEYRYIQSQNDLLLNYIEEQEFAFKDAKGVHENKLKNEVDALHVRRDELQMRRDKLSSKIALSTKLLPEYVAELLKTAQPIPSYDITPIFLEDSSGLFMHASLIKAARALLINQTQGRVLEKNAQGVFPTMPLNQLFGISDKVFAHSELPWRVSIGQAVRYLRFDSLESKTSYTEEIGVFRNSVFSYVLDIERLLVRYTMLIEQSEVLENAVDEAHDNDVYKAHLATMRAEYEKAKTVTALFEALDLY